MIQCKKIVALCGLLFTGPVFLAGQAKNWQAQLQEADTVVRFRKDITDYHFVFEGRSQFFLIDTITDQSNIRQVCIAIQNNTGSDILVKRVYSGDGTITWDGLYNQKIKAGDSYEVRVIYQYRPGPAVRPISVVYEKVPGIEIRLNIRSFAYVLMRKEKAASTGEKTNPPANQPKTPHLQSVKKTPVKPVADTTRSETRYVNGCLKEEVYCMINRQHGWEEKKYLSIQYSDSVCGQKWRERTWLEGKYDIESTYRNGQLCMKRSTLWRKGNFVNESTIDTYLEKGIFREGKLYEGTITYYAQAGQPAYVKNVAAGKVTSLLYKGKKLNITDSLGRKQGVWVTLGTDCVEGELYRANEMCSKCRYRNGQRIDTAFDYYTTGVIKSMAFTLNRKDRLLRVSYSPAGRLQMKWFGNHYARYDSIISYSDTVAGRPVRKYLEDGTEFGYTRGVKSSKTSPRTLHYLVLEEPNSKPIPYTIEKGKFRRDRLWEGVIEYYNERNELTGKKKVKKGMPVN